MAQVFCLYLLGGFRLEKDGAPVKLARQKSKTLLAYLALCPGAYTREQLATLPFPDDMDAQARKNLRVLLRNCTKRPAENFLAMTARRWN